MRQRCNNPSNKNYHQYGGRGIRVCSEWDDFHCFRQWAESSGYNQHAERGKCSLDRINQNGDYSPSNCRWVDMRIQNNNRRDNRLITYGGVTDTVANMARTHGIPEHIIRNRLKLGWDIDRIFEEPVGYYAHHHGGTNKHMITYNGKTQCIADWAREYGLSRDCLKSRLFVYGWDMESALKTPIRRSRYAD